MTQTNNVLHKYSSIDRLFMLGAENDTVIDAVCAFLIAVSPLLQHYRGLFRNTGFTVLLLVFPVLFFRFLLRMRDDGNVDRNCLLAIMPLLLYEIYTSVTHDISAGNVAYGGFMLLMFIFIASGSLNTRFVFRSALLTAKTASALIIVQTMLYYLLRFHLRIIPVALLLPGSDIWIGRALYGVSRAGEMYRPSGFFLEPSHMFLYCVPLLCILLLMPGVDKYRIRSAVLISCGLLLSTSGFGIVLVFAVWGAYMVLYRNETEIGPVLLKLLTPRSIIALIGVMTILVVSYFTVPIVQGTITRIFDSQTGTSVAVSGRVRLANDLIGDLSGIEILIGTTSRQEGFDFNVAGFHATLYKWGIIGVLLSYIYYGRGLFRLKGAYFFISAIIIVISFFSAHTHGTFYMLFYCLFIMNGYYMSDKSFPAEMIRASGSALKHGGLQ